MSTAKQKKAALLTKKERLLRQLNELDTTIEGVMEEEYKEQGILIMNNIDSLLELVAVHLDGSLNDGHSDPKCLRCALLAAEMSEEWLYKEHGINIELDIRKEEILNEEKEEEEKIEQVKKKRGRPAKAVQKEPVLSPNQIKAKEIKETESPISVKTKKLKRVLEINEEEADLPPEWGKM